jgi:hypothetical protein
MNAVVEQSRLRNMTRKSESLPLGAVDPKHVDMQMTTIREFEKHRHIDSATGDVPGIAHLCNGHLDRQGSTKGEPCKVRGRRPRNFVGMHAAINPCIKLNDKGGARGRWHLPVFHMEVKHPLFRLGYCDDEYRMEGGVLKLKSQRLELFFWSRFGCGDDGAW